MVKKMLNHRKFCRRTREPVAGSGAAVVCLQSLLLVVATWSPLVAAQDATRIGFVNIPAIMESSSQAKAAQKRLRDEFTEPRDELDECRDGLNRLDKKLRREGKEMEEKRRQRMIDTVMRKRRECGEIQDDLQEEFNDRRSEELGELQQLIYVVVKKIAEKEDIDLVLGPPIIYKNDQIDLTEMVLEELSKREESSKKSRQ